MAKLIRTFTAILNRETISYVIFGILTTVLNIVVFYLLHTLIGVDLIVANSLAWVVGISFAYVTNRIFVFQKEGWTLSEVIQEFLKFIFARLFSLGVETVGLILLIEHLAWYEVYAKIAMGIIVIVLNYIFSKIVIFI